MVTWRRLWAALAATLSLTACVDLNSPPPPIKKPPPELAERDTGMFAVGGQTSIDLPRPDGSPLFSAKGQVSALMGAEGGTGDLLDVSAESRVPGYEARLTVGRLRYLMGSPEIDIDHRLEVRAPARRATLRAERGTFNTESLEFAISGRARLTYDGALLFMHNARAQLDLRTARGTDFWARRATDSGTWTARARQGEVDANRCVVLSEVTGELTVSGKPAAFTAPRAAWHPADQQLNFEQGLTLNLDDARLHAEAATYQMATKQISTRGTTTLTRAGLSVTGTGGSADLARREATLHGITARLNGDSLRATSGKLGADRTLRLTGVTATLRDGTALRAGTADYRDGGVTASGGVRVAKDGSTLTASRATRSAGGAVTAGGNVRLTGHGMWATGARLTADRSLSDATLTPMRAGGENTEGAWSLSASRGRAAKSSGLTLDNASGVFHGPGRRATASAGRASYAPGAKEVTFSGGFRLSSPSDGLEVRAERGTFDPGGKTFRLTGNVRATVQGASVSGKTWVYRLGRGADEPVVETGR